MLKYQKDTTISSVIAALVTIIGTAAALSYYLAISKYNSAQHFTFVLSSYFSTILMVYYFYNRRYEQNAK